jgi:hypothetical protein
VVHTQSMVTIQTNSVSTGSMKARYVETTMNGTTFRFQF